MSNRLPDGRRQTMPSRPPVIRPSARGDTQHQRKEYDRRRDMQPWRKWYRTARWLAIAAYQLNVQPLCRFCKAKGIIRAATVCDHIHAHKGDPVRFWGGPFQSLCASCHSGEKQRIEAREAREGR